MRTFKQKPLSHRVHPADETASGPDHFTHPLLRWQGIIGNQAVQRMLKPNGRDISLRSGHPFYRIPIPAVQVKQSGDYRVMRDAIAAEDITKWQSYVKKALEEDGKNPDEMEKNFIAALGLIQVKDVNIARDGHKDAKKLKPGLNLDILYTENSAATGFLTNKGWTRHLTLDEPSPQIAIIIGKNAFQSNSPINSIMIVEHEKAHALHDQNSTNLLKEWGKKADQKKFQKEFQRQKAQLERSPGWSSLPQSQQDAALEEIQARLISQWFKGQKRSDQVEQELLYESMGTTKAKAYEGEVLAGLEGFIKGYHLIPIKDGVPDQDLFHELTAYPLADKYWKNIDSKAFKAYYQKTLSNYYWNTLDELHKKAFNKQTAEYEKKNWPIDATEYFKMLKSISTTH